MFFDGEDDLGFKSIAENFADLGEAGFYLAADGGSDFIVSSGIFHVHEAALLYCAIMDTALFGLRIIAAPGAGACLECAYPRDTSPPCGASPECLATVRCV